MRCNQRALVLIVPTLLTLVVQSAIAKDVKTLKINAPMPELNLPGVDDKTYRLADFADAKVLVVIFTCNHCPTAQAYEQRIIKLHADYRDKGVSLVAISPNDPQAVRLDELGYADIGDSFADMKLSSSKLTTNSFVECKWFPVRGFCCWVFPAAEQVFGCMLEHESQRRQSEQCQS